MHAGARLYKTCVFLFSLRFCTAPREDIEGHPAEELLDYIWRTFMTHHYVVSHGVRDVVARLSGQIPDCQIHDDHVVLATQANHAAPLVAAYAHALEEQQAVGAAACDGGRQSYRRPPASRKSSDRRDLNLVMLSSSLPTLDEKSTVGLPLLPLTYAMTTHILPRPAGRAPGVAILHTTNPIIAPRPGSVLSVTRLERALLTHASKAAVRSLCAVKDDGVNIGALQGAARREYGSSAAGLWVVGSYAYSGMPLLEGCVASAREIVEHGILRSEGASVHDFPW
ncbi:hypothetical protein EI94DRAFT_337320 [Lactarius quietus]|nr:hypothetical protein EI94DRAFT_337320 [Lactarius quietus]